MKKLLVLFLLSSAWLMAQTYGVSINGIANQSITFPSGVGGGILVYSATVDFTGTLYIPIGGGGAANSTESTVQIGAPTNYVIQNMYVSLSAAPGADNSVALTYRKASSSQALTCTISGGSATGCSDLSDNFTGSQGDLLDIQAVATGSPGSLGIVISIQYGMASTVPTRTHGIGAGFDGSGSALTSGSTATTYFTIPYSCTISAWNITVDTGTITFDIWKVATGSSIPTSSNSITASAQPALSTGTALHSTTLSGWSTTVSANDIFGINIKTVSSATKASLVVECDQ